MRELNEQLADAVAQIGGRWDDDRTNETYIRLEHKRARRAVMRRGAAVVAVLAVVGGGVWLSTRSGTPEQTVAENTDLEQAVSPQPALVEPEIVLTDVVTPEGDATIDVVPMAGDRVSIAVVDGKGVFAVPAEVRDRVDVSAGRVSIAVYASAFSVARYGERTDIAVTDGYLEVLYDGVTERVSEGETRRFGPAEEVEIPADDVEPIAPVARKKHASSDWRPLAKDGNFDDAFDALERAGGTSAVRDDVSDLLLAADVFRITGHPSKAVVPLQRVVSGYRSDPRTPLAAFTLGRVLLDDLGRPAKAAAAFRTARDLAPGGGLAEDALAREVEAWSKAGKLGKARDRAELYIESYPRGHRVRAVKKYGGL